MRFSRVQAAGLVLTGLLISPGTLPAQSEKVMIQELQRDIAQLQNQMRQSREAQDQKNAELEALLKQSLDANAKLTSELGTLHQSLTASMAEQQSKMVQPINLVGNKVDQISQSFGTLQTSMDEIIRRLTKDEERLTEILSNVKTLSSAQQPAPPPPAGAPGGGTASLPGASADVAFQAAERDFRSGRNQLAMDEFLSFISQYPNSVENASKAQYYIGVIYDRDEDYANSVKAYDAVLERYPENPTTRDALYGKAVALMKQGDHNVEAKKEFTAFLKKYSTDDKANQVRQYLADLNAPAHSPARSQKGKR